MNVNLRYNFQKNLIMGSETKHIEIVGFFLLALKWLNIITMWCITTTTKQVNIKKCICNQWTKKRTVKKSITVFELVKQIKLTKKLSTIF